MKSILQMFKIGAGPNSLMNVAPYRACAKIAKDINENDIPVDHIDVCFYHEFARLEPQVKTSINVLKAFEGTGIKVNILTDRKAPPAARHPLTFDVLMYNKAGDMLGRHRILSTGGGNYTMTDKLPHPSVYFFADFEEMRRYFNVHKDESYMDFVCKYQSRAKITTRFDECIALMDKVIDEGVSKEGRLDVGNDDIYYIRRAKSILNNVQKNESEDQEMIRVISAYAYAIGEQAVTREKIVISPSVGTTGIFWSTLRYIREKKNPSRDQIYNAMALAGLLCSLVEQNASISANDAGCQAEISTGCGMAAVALSSLLYNCDINEAGRAWEMAIEHALGIVCGSVCGIPLIPCVQRAASFAVRAYEIAVLNHSLMGSEELCKLDDVIAVMLETGADLLNKNRAVGSATLATRGAYAILPEDKLPKGKK